MTGRNSLHYCYDVSYRCWFASEEAEIYCYNFNFFIEECCVVIEKNIDRKLANRISYRIWYKRCLKGKFGSRGGGVQICEVGSISASGFGPGGSKSAVTPNFSKLTYVWCRKWSRDKQSHGSVRWSLCVTKNCLSKVPEHSNRTF